MAVIARTSKVPIEQAWAALLPSPERVAAWAQRLHRVRSQGPDPQEPLRAHYEQAVADIAEGTIDATDVLALLLALKSAASAAPGRPWITERELHAMAMALRQHQARQLASVSRLPDPSPRHSYQFTRINGGFRVVHPLRQTVTIRRGGEMWEVTSASSGPTLVGAAAVSRLVETIAQHALADWQPALPRLPSVLEPIAGQVGKLMPIYSPEVRQHYRRRGLMQVARALARRTTVCWRDLLPAFPPDVVAIGRRVWAFTHVHARVLAHPAFWRHHLLRQDCLRLRGAATAVGMTERFLTEDGTEVPHIIEALAADWQRVLWQGPRWRSHHASVPGPVRRIAAQWPGSVPPTLITALGALPWSTTPRSRHQLLLSLATRLALQRRGEAIGNPESDSPDDLWGPMVSVTPRVDPADRVRFRHIAMIDRASEADVAAMVAVAIEEGMTELRRWPVRPMMIADLAQELVDYPGPACHTLTSLVRRTCAWRMRMLAPAEGEDWRADPLRSMDPATPLPVPSFPMPLVPGIRHLATAGDLRDEGRHMRHCCASYLGKVLAGQGHFFHCDHAGEEATAFIGPRGEVLQVRGPGNATNRATAWARAQFMTALISPGCGLPGISRC